MAELFRSKNFVAFFAITFFNALILFSHKVMLQLLTAHMFHGSAYSLFATLVTLFTLLPFVLLFAPCGFFADKYAKTQIIRFSSSAIVPICVLLIGCYSLSSYWLALGMMLVLAVQAAIITPALLGFVKEEFGKENLAESNAWLLAGVVFALMLAYSMTTWSSIAMTSVSQVMHAYLPVTSLLFISAVIQTILAFALTKHAATDPASVYDLQQHPQKYYSLRYLQMIYRNRVTLTSVIGLSLFWAIYLSLAMIFDTHYGGSAYWLLASSIGLILGALYAGKISRGFIETGIIPIAAIGISASMLLVTSTNNVLLAGCWFFIFGFCGGMIIVALNSLIQFNTPRQYLGKTLAASFFAQALTAIALTLLTIPLANLWQHQVFMLNTLNVLAISATVVVFFKLPQSLIRYVLYFTLSKFYKLDVYGIEHLPSTGGVLMLGNHTSYIDWAIIQMASPRPVRFVMERALYGKWYVKWVLRAVKVIPISRKASKQSLQHVRKALENGELVVMFPEGYLSRNGQIGRFLSGYQHAVEGTDAVIVPFYLRGLWGSATSYAPSYYKQVSRQRLRNIGIAFGKPMPATSQPDEIKQRVFEISIRAWRHYTESLGTIPHEWLRITKRLGHELCVADSNGKELNYYKFAAAVFSLIPQWRPMLRKQSRVAIMLPPSIGGSLANMAMLCLGKTVVNLNYLATDLISTFIAQANLEVIITSRTFIEKLKQRGIDIEPLIDKMTVIFIEDFRRCFNPINIFWKYLFVRLMPRTILQWLTIKSRDVNEVAAILFSSGSEGKPKGVELTHRNILGNAKQIASVTNFLDTDVLVSCLPLFHAFGLCTTTIMPLVQGIPFVCHPDATDVVKIAQLIYRYQATIMCGSSTLFSLYCRHKKVHPLLLKSLRIVIAGSEKLAPSVYEQFQHKFGLTIYEGYGTTEVAPVASTNLPDIINPNDWHVHVSHKPGTVGLPLPGSAFRIVDPESLTELPIGEDGMILIGGTQVMRGYLDNPTKSQQVLIQDGDITWYITGDKGRLDNDGFLTVIDRYSRFAKIGGEMISLTHVENSLRPALEALDVEFLITSVDDNKKGEKIALLFAGECTVSDIHQSIKQSSLASLSKPNVIKKVTNLPRLTTGKLDYLSAKKILTAS